MKCSSLREVNYLLRLRLQARWVLATQVHYFNKTQSVYALQTYREYSDSRTINLFHFQRILSSGQCLTNKIHRTEYEKKNFQKIENENKTHQQPIEILQRISYVQPSLTNPMQSNHSNP